MVHNCFRIGNEFWNKFGIHLIVSNLLVIVCFQSMLRITLYSSFPNNIFHFTIKFSKIWLLILFILIMNVINISKLYMVNWVLIWNYISTICCHENKRIVFSWKKILLWHFNLKARSFTSFSIWLSQIYWNNSFQRLDD